jgi:hypothetical protein
MIMQVWHFLELIDNQREATRFIMESRKLIINHHLPSELDKFLEKAEKQLSLFRTQVASYKVEAEDGQKETQAAPGFASSHY